jgi:hypothetical protein
VDDVCGREIGGIVKRSSRHRRHRTTRSAGRRAPGP